MTSPRKTKRHNPLRRNRAIDAQNAKRIRVYLKGLDEPPAEHTQAIIAQAIDAGRVTHIRTGKRTRSDRVR